MWRTVDGGGRGKHELGDAGGAQLQQANGRRDIDVEKDAGIDDGFGDGSLGRKVKAHLRRVLVDDFAQHRDIGDVAAIEGSASRHRLLVTGGQIVEHHHLVPLSDQLGSADRTDVARATCNQNLHL